LILQPISQQLLELAGGESQFTFDGLGRFSADFLHCKQKQVAPIAAGIAMRKGQIKKGQIKKH
jgi:hypothetical protein